MRTLATAACLLTLTACGTAERPVTAPPPTTSTTAPGPQPLPERAATTAQRVTIPSIGVDSTLVPLTLDAAGALQAPSDYALAGWYTDGPTPGDPGPAVIAGHVDSRSGPAVFFRLRDLVPGDRVAVTRSDATSASFTVDAVERYPKAEFPTAAVYGPTPGPSLRLITCGGDFDSGKRSYEDNIVVYATADAS
ncbi:class F sortase [Actinokineospora bangkokensis]|uniref:Class F sortase n=1 Tax=Actinokineospora bangkokensis TaxID=1193682 RepID=A0A1Q9LQV7_9PSEU|nr:class F sortase [Actinokineospora bangkokensis]OLR94402.1 class F sortase [Actinokineospora bangkokensis]